MSEIAGDEIAVFYNAHPYPPPVEDLDGEIEPWADGTRRRVEHTRLWPTLPYRDDHTILVAGCGTYQAARYALHYPRAEVVGIDVSPTSLDATRRLIENHRLNNLELQQLPIESAGTLGRQFDHVVCTGVLHHLVDPDAGVRALRDILAPEGAMHLMVYAPYGRMGIHAMREYCERLGVQPTPPEMDDLVATLRELPAEHPMRDLLRTVPDFHDDGAIADALLNPRDRAYTVAQVHQLIASAGLRFARWVRQAPYRPQCGSMSETPHAALVAAMADPDQAAAMELFRGTMRGHSLIVHRDDSPLPDPLLTWDHDAWPSYIPVRPNTVVTVEERLPPGVTAALINRAHTDRDLVYFADAHTRAAYDAIDGSTPLGGIHGATAELFGRLWWH
ncbi:MAG: class I SAM-dependent methyltransferase, partial [Acidimicrobiia bacterium]|nr:class I SAM-dependent methyltransferase [Acidimicrobiia bacterium]